MRPLPSGTVTLLFTDIEGSTRLLEKLGAEYEAVLAAHRRLIREAVAAHDGVEVDTQGDAFLCSFPRASDAVEAAAEAQRALAGGPVSVRMGIHTGEPTLTAEGYVGVDLHRGARVMAAAHGGQVLLSHVTHDLLAEVPLRDLGEHRLKDLSEPQKIYQLLGDGLQSDFPAPRTLENRPTNLPMQPTRLVGREHELEQVVELLGREQVRLLTLTGPGGTGKTRLALQAAAELVESYPQGVWFVNLAALKDPDLVVPTIAQTLGLKEQPGEPIADTLAHKLKEQELLLLLDNFEQVAEAAHALGELLRKTRALNVIVTSRSSLHLQAEQEYPVPHLAETEAVALFAERAQAAKPSFSLNGNRPVVAEICRRLDRLPLAIELAAARIKLLPEQALLERLDDKLKLLTGGARDLDERQRTLRAAIDWSYELLSEKEQMVFRRLAVFTGGRSLEAIEAICNPDGDLEVFEGVASLVDKSLVRQEETEEGEPRFVMLETIHEYAREKLEQSGETGDSKMRHARYFLELAQNLRTAANEGRRLAVLRAEHDNLRTALGSLRAAEAVDEALRLGSAMAQLWQATGAFGEGRAALEAALAHSATASQLDRVDALCSVSAFAYYQGDYEASRARSEEAVQLARALGDDDEVARSLVSLGLDLAVSGDAERGIAALQEAVDTAATTQGLAPARGSLGYAKLLSGDADGSVAEFQAALELFVAAGDFLGAAQTLFNIGLAHLERGADDEAERSFHESLGLLSEFRQEFGLAYALLGLAAVKARRGNGARAATLVGAADAALDSMDASPEPYEAHIREAALRAALDELGDEAFERALAEGRGMTLDQAVDYVRAS